MGSSVSTSIKPMLATLARELPRGDYLYEPKWDGFRALAFRGGADVDIRSRNDRPLARYFPELVAALRGIEADRFVVDGEILAEGRRGYEFTTLMTRLHPAASRVELLSAAGTHGGAPVERIETHASIVFIAGARALKLKRAVRYDYLDFSTPARRQAMCEAEVRVNKRTAPGLYRAVLSVTREADGSLSFDQVGFVVNELRRNPESRRLVVSAWHPANAAVSRLPPCHFTWVLNVQEDACGTPRLHCHLTQRSADLALGVPFNLACYALLTRVIA
jgi:hypothetical protein